MDCWVGRGRHQRRLILLICVGSFSLATELIDLTTVRVAALPLSRLEGWSKSVSRWFPLLAEQVLGAPGQYQDAPEPT